MNPRTTLTQLAADLLLAHAVAGLPSGQTYEIRAINAQGVVSGEKWENGPGLYTWG